MRKAGFLATAALVTALVAGQAAAEEIRVLNWQGYGTDEAWATEFFEAQTSITVVHDYFNSEQEMLTKLRTSPGAYDVVLINSAFTQQAADEGLIQAIDPSTISNFVDLAPGLRDAGEFKLAGNLYGVAWTWGLTSIAYDYTEVEPTGTINILWDPAYAGRVALRDDSVENIYIAALATGQNMNDPQDLDAIREKLRALKPQLRTYWASEDEWNKEFAADTFDVASYWSGSASRSAKTFGMPVGFLIPAEGAIAWLDGLSIAADAPNPEGAAQFIDFMVSAYHYMRWDTEVGAPASANAAVMNALPASAFNRQVLGNPAATANLQFMAPLSDEKRELFLEIWEETKAYYAE
ncbi:MAG: extracellular solute-binding protein [Rhodospirillaceae bacterium]|jgi:spermidine/putrescine transport system substrate-binding protein|nr:extracellular solute-binding protein [Rhodospirillaceae bacterium]MBT6202074.1 extracellular solute-binding protein [Rhodospirillaceae bacterium]MBT6512694.1 extracellular solute-binding protein [Rhodospirillaceae bacterium]